MWPNIVIKATLLVTNYYRLQRSWGKVMFLHLSVILFTGGIFYPGSLCPGGWSLSRGRGLCPGCGSLSKRGSRSRGWVSVQGGSLSGGLCPGGVSVQGGSLSRGVSVQGGSLSGRPPRMVTCRRYASYWNAFFSSKTNVVHFRTLKLGIMGFRTSPLPIPTRRL